MPATAEAMVRDIASEHADAIRDAVGDLSNVEVFNNQILVGIFKRPDKLKSGLYTAPTTQKEDEYQGKAMLILKVGALAFQDPNGRWFSGVEAPKVGDWIVARPGDTWQLAINRYPCRMMNDTAVRLKIPDPMMIW
jgi:hypothetical protein